MSSITNSYSTSFYSSYYQNPKDSNTNKTTSEIYVNLTNQDSKTALPSDAEILNEITSEAQFYQQSWRGLGTWTATDNLFAMGYSGASLYQSGTTIDQWDMGFIDAIESKLKSKINSPITQQDAEQAQKFLYEQMDNIMLSLYKENPQLMQETMKKNHQFYVNGGLYGDFNNQSLGGDEKLANVLLDYGARTESERLENLFTDYLGNIGGILNSFLSGGEAETKEIKNIQVAINVYRANKMEATGFNFFAAVADKLSPALQEQITDAIANIMSFYSQPHSMEVNGYKVSWKSQYEAEALGKIFGSGGVLTSVACTDISIEFSSGFTPNFSQDTLLSLASTFDSSQTFFEVLEQRDKLEKANQDLKAQQAYNVYGISNTTNSIQTDSTDSIMQTLLKDAKDSKENREA